MNASGSLEFAYARLSARMGASARTRRCGGAWRSCATCARCWTSCAPRRWRRGWPASAMTAGVRAIETRCARRHWRALVQEVADWMPARLAAGGAVVRGAGRPARAGPPRRRRPPCARGCARTTTCRACVDPALGRVDRARAALGARKRGRCAAHGRRLARPVAHAACRSRCAARPALQRLARMLEEHGQRFAHAHPADAWPLRRALAGRVCCVFRRARCGSRAGLRLPGAAALDYERLRGELVPRALFPRRALAA